MYLNFLSYHAKFIWFLQKRYTKECEYLSTNLMTVSPLFKNPIFIRQFEKHAGWDPENELNIKYHQAVKNKDVHAKEKIENYK